MVFREVEGMRSRIHIVLTGLMLGILTPSSSEASLKETFANLFKRCGTCAEPSVCHDSEKLAWCQKKCMTQLQGNLCTLPTERQPSPLFKKDLEALHSGRKESMINRLHSSLAGTGDPLFGVLSKHP